jgi:hypothetical protein
VVAEKKLYKHAVIHHSSKCSRSGTLIPIPAEEFMDCKERVRHWSENCRQRRARLRASLSAFCAEKTVSSASFDVSFDVPAPQVNQGWKISKYRKYHDIYRIV